MVVPLAGKKHVTVSQIIESFPGQRGAKRTAPATVSRWILKGCKSVSGEIVRLKATRVGYRWLVDPADLEAFFTALGAPVEETAKVPTPTQRPRAAELADAKLAAAGA